MDALTRPLGQAWRVRRVYRLADADATGLGERRGAAEREVRKQAALKWRQREPDAVIAEILGQARPQRLRGDCHISHRIKRQLLKQFAQEERAPMRRETPPTPSCAAV